MICWWSCAHTGLAVGGLEFLPTIPDYAYRYASFLFSFLGRGICKLSLSDLSAGVEWMGGY